MDKGKVCSLSLNLLSRKLKLNFISMAFTVFYFKCRDFLWKVFRKFGTCWDRWRSGDEIVAAIGTLFHSPTQISANQNFCNRKKSDKGFMEKPETAANHIIDKPTFWSRKPPSLIYLLDLPPFIWSPLLLKTNFY